VKAYFARKDSAKLCFELLLLPSDGSFAVPSEDIATQAAMAALRGATIAESIAWDNDPAIVTVPPFGSVQVDWWGTGTLQTRFLEWNPPAISQIEIKFNGTPNMAVNNRLHYGLAPTA